MWLQYSGCDYTYRTIINIKLKKCGDEQNNSIRSTTNRNKHI